MRNNYFVPPEDRPRDTEPPPSWPELVDEQWALFCGEDARTTLIPLPQEQARLLELMEKVNG